MLRLAWYLSALAFSNGAFAQSAVLPPGVKAVWDLDKAYREQTPTRERVCLNGLWRWQPGGRRSVGADPRSEGADGAAPSNSWGYFKVPGCWPGITDYMQKDCQTLFRHPDWKSEDISRATSAWYQREITIPAGWHGRRIAVSAETLNSFAAVYVDGKKAGEMRFPAGEVDITSLCKLGGKHLLSMFVEAMPLKAVRLSYTDTNAAREVKGSVARRGLCGDVFLESSPSGPRLSDVSLTTSFRQSEVAFHADLNALLPSTKYRVKAEVLDRGKVVAKSLSPVFSGTASGKLSRAVSISWKPSRLWDIHTPQNQFTARLSLLSSSGTVLDISHPVRFGFREFWISGRDFYLNGSRIYLSSVPLDNAQVGAAWSTYEGAKESLLRLKSFGINFVYTHNYDCEPGSHLSFNEILRAADDVGMLVALSQPHFSSYDWKAPDADKTNGYARDAAHYVRVAGNHPSVVFYAMSHNATSYDEAKNPDKIDGIYEGRDNWARNNVQLALRAERIVKAFDPSRIVYHHSSGNLGAMYTENFYVNFAPKQELSDWFEHWATKGVKPLFLCEYGVPFSWDWTMYRGWYKGKREWGSARVPWDLSIAEWNAQFYGDRAFELSETAKRDIRWEAKQFQSSDGWHRWDYPVPVGSSAFEECSPIFADYITDNWRAYRTLGVSATSPWEYEIFWKLRPGVDRSRKELPANWERLQRPGFSPDYVDSQYETMNLSYGRSDWVPTPAATALLRNDRPLLAYIGGKSSRFTSKDHNFRPGDLVEKQLVVINNSRITVTCRCSWTVGRTRPMSGASIVTVPTGQQAHIPVRFRLPTKLDEDPCLLQATFRFSNGEIQRDNFAIDIAVTAEPPSAYRKIALYDPNGETRAVLDRAGYKYQAVDASSDLSGFNLLVIGKKALTLNGSCPDLRRVRQGLKVVIFEQSAEVLEQRFGFRIAEYGLRQVFPRVAGHPALAGISEANLSNWTGQATLSTPRLEYTLKPMYGPMVKWCGLDVPRVWRCGCQGNVASVLIEKPSRGDFLPILDGGYGLQYSPLLEYHEGEGMVLFCQMDVSGRSETDPAAQLLARNVVWYAGNWKPASRRRVVYAGEQAGYKHLESAGFSVGRVSEGRPAEGVLVLGPGCGKDVTRQQVAGWVAQGGRIVAAGLGAEEVEALFGGKVHSRRAEHIAASFETAPLGSWRCGVGPADVMDRDPHELALITTGAEIVGDGVLAATEDSRVVFCQLAPWMSVRGFDAAVPPNQKRTFRRASYLFSRLVANQGGAASTRILDDASEPIKDGVSQTRWLDGLYLDIPEEWDDPYRFFPW